LYKYYYYLLGIFLKGMTGMAVGSLFLAYIETIHEYRASSYLEQTVSASHRSWRSWKVFPNEVHQRAKSLLRVWSTGNS
jgi:hypothetical protein